MAREADLGPGLRPSVVLMNPPFSAAAHVEGRPCAQRALALLPSMGRRDRVRLGF